MREFIVQTDMDLNGVVEFSGAGGVSFKPKEEIIRCKDCKHWNANNDTHRCFVWCVYTCGDGYCHRAERKEE